MWEGSTAGSTAAGLATSSRAGLEGGVSAVDAAGEQSHKWDASERRQAAPRQCRRRRRRRRRHVGTWSCAAGVNALSARKWFGSRSWRPVGLDRGGCESVGRPGGAGGAASSASRSRDATKGSETWREEPSSAHRRSLAGKCLSEKSVDRGLPRSPCRSHRSHRLEQAQVESAESAQEASGRVEQSEKRAPLSGAGRDGAQEEARTRFGPAFYRGVLWEQAQGEAGLAPSCAPRLRSVSAPAAPSWLLTPLTSYSRACRTSSPRPSCKSRWAAATWAPPGRRWRRRSSPALRLPPPARPPLPASRGSRRLPRPTPARAPPHARQAHLQAPPLWGGLCTFTGRWMMPGTPAL